ncbi:hypothetical protein B0H65DRAFT_445063 [Neurospora tetraspora]|uniref:Uncharacterized protein n=1 Tax=Neurospora tetraspora TaxID=94610 RepID=A0AAE0MN39_9PEZI|nr:hypothetical protein B0H65DRAFT_445063 [Neurospora tetraspora]
MADNTNIEALIESRIEAAISAVQDLPQLLEEAAENNSVVLLDMWYKILIHMYNNLVSPTGTLRSLNEIEFTMVSDQERPRYSDFIKLAHRWLVAMHCAGVGEQAFANLAQYKPRLNAEVLEVLAPHELEQCEKRSNMRKVVDQEYPGHIKSEAEFRLRKGALMTTTVYETEDSEVANISHTEEEKIEFVKKLVKAMANMTGIADKANHHHVQAVKAISGSVVEELGWEFYVYAREAQQGRTWVLPWNTSFTWQSYATFEDRWADIVDFFHECKSAVANALQATYIQRYTSDPHREHTRPGGGKFPSCSTAARDSGRCRCFRPDPYGWALTAVANSAEGINIAPVDQVAMSPNVAPAVAPEVAAITSPSEASIDGNFPAAPPNSPIMNPTALAPGVAGVRSADDPQDGFDF